MDDTDTEILRALQRDGRAAFAQIARELGVPVSTINDRVRRLHEAGAIREYATHVDPQSVGLGVCAFVQVLISDPERESAFLASVGELTEVQECHSVSGEFSYLLKVRVRDTDEVGEFLREVLRQLPGVGQTNTMIALTTAKETTALRI